jgi:hypothetical protein
MPDFSVDAQVGRLLIEVKSGARGVRTLVDGLWRLASALADTPELRGLLVLHRPGLGAERIEAERRHAEAVLRPDVTERIRWLVVGDRALRGFPDDLGPEVRSAVSRLILEGEGRRPSRPDRGFASLAVLHVLLDRWLRSGGPAHTNELMATVGCSYPTVAAALAGFRDDIVRHRDRRVELERWPRLAWMRYVSVQDRVRGTERYVDRSGTPRPVPELVRRLARLKRTDVAVGGIPGALHHVNALDVVGTPTLALTLHDPEGTATSEFVERLDPALARTESVESAPLVVVHRQRLRRFLASDNGSGPPWADPIECLLDLHEAGLDGLAEQFRDTAIRRRGQRA